MKFYCPLRSVFLFSLFRQKKKTHQLSLLMNISLPRLQRAPFKKNIYD